MADLRHDLLLLAYRLLSQTTEAAPAVFSVTVHTPDHSADLTYTSRPGEFGGEQGELTTRQRTILEVFRGNETLQAKQIGARTGYRNNSALRSALAEMVQLGLLVTGEEGYRRG